MLYVVSPAILVTAVWLIGESLYRTRWATLALLAALMMKHAVAKSVSTRSKATSTRTAGVCTRSARHRRLSARTADTGILLVAASALVHPTTAMWFAIWLGVAVMVVKPWTRAPVVLGGVLLVGLVLAAGPMTGPLTPMDGEWLATLAEKDYLFPLEWPAWVWVVSAGYVVLVVWPFRLRRVAGLVTDREQAIVIGALSLVAVFLLILPFNAHRIQLAVQLQPARAFWMLDFLATIYVIWLLAEGGLAAVGQRARLAAMAVLALSVVRGVYVMFVEFPDRPVVAFDIPNSDWGRTMRWARATETSSGWLADPMHAVLYGTSVRVAGERDVFVEGVKDVAIGMYRPPCCHAHARSPRYAGGFPGVDRRSCARSRTRIRARLPRDRTGARAAGRIRGRVAQGLSAALMGDPAGAATRDSPAEAERQRARTADSSPADREENSHSGPLGSASDRPLDEAGAFADGGAPCPRGDFVHVERA